MNSVIFNPVEEFDSKYRELHANHTNQHFESLVQQSGVDIQQNRQTVALYNEYTENLARLKKMLNWLRFFRVLMCISLLLIPLVILTMTPKIRALRTEIAAADQRASELLEEAYRQMQPLNGLFTDRDALNLIETTLPLVNFSDCFSVQQEADMRLNYDFTGYDDVEQSSVDVLAGHYNENPFLFENRRIHTMGTETYHGHLTISWTETYYEDGKLRTRTRTQTLHASLVKPKPFYHTQVVLNYCTQGGPELTFSRDAAHVEQKSEKALDRLVKKGEKSLKKQTDKAIKKGEEFMAMSNTEFEVLFDATNRTNEVQFRTLFTPLAQTNMVALLRSKTGFGDDFHFFKTKRTNRIVSEHSQGRVVNLSAKQYVSHSFDVIKSNFIDKNASFFKAVYFDFAPLLAIPMYQERPVHSLKPVPQYNQQYSLKECEALANSIDAKHFVHPNTKTNAILKAAFVANKDQTDETCITAYSYDMEERLDFVPVRGGDGKIHPVPVPWFEYIPLVSRNHVYVSTDKAVGNNPVMASRNGLCLFQS